MSNLPPSPSKSSSRPRTKLRRRVDSSGAASQARGSPARATPRRDSWEDDEGELSDNDELLLRKAAAVPPSKRKRRPPAPTPPSAFSPAVLFRPFLRLLSFAVTPLCSWIITLFLPIALLTLVIWLGVTTIKTALSTSLSTFLPAGMQTVVGVYCATIGVGCPKTTDDRVIGAAARQATARAEQALDVFQSLLKMGGEDSQGLALHPVE
ncbi:hypothetical protein BCR35DRAFT_208298 [Leucosporidium creatinivorum]|uniref:Uncharacterized protein n=1 Tax=Leucosporidium creatinivorum TaxID=106004 RepID=A0A1Y2FXY0_9BASI|nr:hypothetical protein BCR35DRAFT_208298 [Leucosporidium creatinivorum]